MASSPTPTRAEADPAAALRDAIARAVAVVGLAGVALDAPGTFQDQAYKGWLYVGLIVSCLITAAALVRSSDARAWTAAALLPLGALVGFVVSRSVGLPGGADDIGNWTESLGLASLMVEGALIALAGAVLRDRATKARSVPRLAAALSWAATR